MFLNVFVITFIRYGNIYEHGYEWFLSLFENDYSVCMLMACSTVYVALVAMFICMCVFSCFEAAY